MTTQMGASIPVAIGEFISQVEDANFILNACIVASDTAEAKQ